MISTVAAVPMDLVVEQSARDVMLRRECHVFTRALCGVAPTDYVIAHYIRGHDTIPFARHLLGALDQRLLRAASAGGWQLRSADAFARFFLPDAALRQKLVLLLAILEHSPVVHSTVDTALVAGRALTVLRLLGALLRFGGLLLLGIVRFAPQQLLERSGRRA